MALAGATHLVNIWTYGPHPRSVAVLQTVLKLLTAAISCATAFLLVTIIPALLNVKVTRFVQLWTLHLLVVFCFFALGHATWSLVHRLQEFAVLVGY